MKKKKFSIPKEMSKTFYVIKDNFGNPQLSTSLTIQKNVKCFKEFYDAYLCWLESLDEKTLVIEVDTSTFSKGHRKYAIAYSYRLIKNKQVIRDVTCYYGEITAYETNEIGIYGIAEIIGATAAMKEAEEFMKDTNKIIIRHDNKYIAEIPLRKLPTVNKINQKYILDYLKIYHEIAKKCNYQVYFHHVFSHVGDKAHDGIDRRAKKINHENKIFSKMLTTP